ncbi:MAG: D-alanyl-D-alanine carboxypeptidase family protein [Eubacteriales bacterium]
MKRITGGLSLLLLSLMIISSFFVFPASADSSITPPTVQNCRAACLYDKTHDRILVMENPDTPLNTSTSAKVMMGLIACEMLSDRLDETVTITDEMLSGASGYSMQLKSGEIIKIKDLLYGAICGSYNDAGYAIASICSGSSVGFVSAMNERAKALGAASTSYTNPLGYPDNDAMITTLSDTLKLASAASENQLYMELCSAKKHEISATNLSGARTVYNRNYLVSSRSTQAYYNPVCSGMNAGISGERGGWSVITLAHDDGADYICIILGGEESEDGKIYAYDAANRLINWACDTYNLYKVFNKGQIIGKAEVGLTALGSQKVDYALSDDLSVYIPDRSNPSITYKTLFVSDKLKAPIKAGEKIGIVSVYCDGEIVGEGGVVLLEDCESNVFMKAVSALGDYTKSRAFIAAIVCFAVLLPIVLIVKNNRSHRKYKRRY